MTEAPIAPISVQRIEPVIGSERFREFQNRARDAKRFLEGRVIWNINSTAQGGGVAEMLLPLLGYLRDLGIDSRWLVVSGDADFFVVTKRIHNNIHGHAGDGGPLGDAERTAYEATMTRNLERLGENIGPRDIVICHDPQTAGLLPVLRKRAAAVIWRCHIGHDHPNDLSLQAWDFLAPYLSHAHAHVFHRMTYVPPQVDREMVTIIAPSIDPLSAKNQPLTEHAAEAILINTGILEGPNGQAEPCFKRHDGSTGRVERQTEVFRTDGPLAQGRRTVVQVSRWDALKDPIGVMQGFARALGNDSTSLVLAGPSVAAVADDPEGALTLDQVRAAWSELPEEWRKDVHIACLPMEDLEENAAIVNALQRHASVVVQKSLYEGFGLTVTEAMWKARPVVASAVGGIQDQIDHGVDGMLLADPSNLDAFGQTVKRVLDDPDQAGRLGANAQRRVETQFLANRHLTQYLDLFAQLLE